MRWAEGARIPLWSLDLHLESSDCARGHSFSYDLLLTFCIVGFASEKAMGDWLLDSVERWRGGKQLGRWQTKIGMVLGKTIVVALCCTCACVVPDFEGIFGLVGSFPVAMSTFILPAAFNLKLYWAQLSTGAKVGNALIILFGVLGAIFGSVAAIIGIVDFFRDGETDVTYPNYCPDPQHGGW